MQALRRSARVLSVKNLRRAATIYKTLISRFQGLLLTNPTNFCHYEISMWVWIMKRLHFTWFFIPAFDQMAKCSQEIHQVALAFFGARLVDAILNAVTPTQVSFHASGSRHSVYKWHIVERSFWKASSPSNCRKTNAKAVVRYKTGNSCTISCAAMAVGRARLWRYKLNPFL